MFSRLNAGFSSSDFASRKRSTHKGFSHMELGVVISIVLAMFFCRATSSGEILCRPTSDCRAEDVRISSGSGSNFTCCRGNCTNNTCSEAATKNANNSIKLNNSGSPNNAITNTTATVNSGQSNSTRNLNVTKTCSTDNQCLAPLEKCFSHQCVRKASNDLPRACLCDGCQDGRCHNVTISTMPTLIPTNKPEISTIQLILLFGSMGGIFVFILIVYCVKTFTDNRRRQYLLKYGVWENPKESNTEKGEPSDGHSESQRHQKKLEVPTILVQMESETTKQKEGNKSDGKDDTDNVTAMKQDQDVKLDQPPVKVEVKQEKPVTQQKSENLPVMNATATQAPYSTGKTKTLTTKESPKKLRGNNTASPASTDKDIAPLAETPKKNRFPVLRKNKDSPKKIIANGTPEKSSKFKAGNSPTVQLCEPENFSDFGL